jgi:hypothetical protein
MKKDYSQNGDPYGIAEEYTAQSAAVDLPTEPKCDKVGGDRDIRGNRLIQPRSVPTQAEVDVLTKKH